MVFKFRIPSGVSGALGMPDCLICPYKTASLGATSKSKLYETRPANIEDPQHRIRVCIRGILKKCYSGLGRPFCCSRRMFWTTWWLRTQCQLQSVMININSHGHGMYYIKINFLFSLKRSFQNPSCVLAHPLLN
jgi:hypothetical protein